jgi:hypothetical protein
MSFLFLPLVISLGICLVPIWLLPRRKFQRARDYFVASQPTPPNVIRNSSVAHLLRIVTFGPFFAWGASGDFWPAIVSAACFGLGVYLIYLLRRPLLTFLDSALSGNASMTVHAFIANWHGNDARVRLLASGLTVAALTGLITAEAFATATLVKPVMMENAGSVFLLAAGMLVLTVLYTIFSGNSGVMHSIQLQLGMMYLGLFGSTALLLYFLVSDVSPMPPHGRFAVVFIAAACAFILYYRSSKYVDTTPIRRTNWRNNDVTDGARSSLASRLLSRLEKILNPSISVIVVLAIVLTVMEFFSVGVPLMARDSITALQTGTDISGTALLAIALVSLLYPIVDVANWQKLAAIVKDTDSEPGWRSATIARIFISLAVEVPLLWLLMCMFGAIAVVATETPASRDALKMFIRQLALEQNLPASLAMSLLLVGMFAMALSAMSSMFSASLWILRYDMLPAFWPDLGPERIQPGDEAIARRRTILAGSGFCLAAILLVHVADSFLGIGFTSSTFLGLLFVCCCAQLSFAPLVLAPILGAVSAPWALLIVGVAAASGIAAVIVYLATGAEPWLWAAIPACLGSGVALFAVARLWPAARRSLRH